MDVESVAASNLQIVFLHLAKTGGTTLHELLVEQLGEAALCPERDQNLVALSDEDLKRYRFFSGHFQRDGIQRAPLENATRICILRDPAERALSHFNFWKSYTYPHIDALFRQNHPEADHVRKTKTMTFEEFVIYFHDPKSHTGGYFRNQQAKALTGLAGDAPELEIAYDAIDYLSTFQHVLLTPLLNLQIPEMFRDLGLEPPALIPKLRDIRIHHQEDDGLEWVELAKLDGRTRQLIEEHNVADRLLYDHFLQRAMLDRLVRNGAALSQLAAGQPVQHRQSDAPKIWRKPARKSPSLPVRAWRRLKRVISKGLRSLGLLGTG